MNKSNIMEYTHPDYLNTDDTLDRIGQASFDDWDSSYIEKSKIHKQIPVTQVDGSKRGIWEIRITLLTPQDEAETRKTLNNFEPTNVNESAHDSKPIRKADLFELNTHIVVSSCMDSLLFYRDKMEINLASEEDRVDLKNLLNLTQATNTLRNALVQGNLRSYTSQDREYKKILSNEWENSEQWYRLLIEGYIRDSNKKQQIHCLKRDVESFADSLSLKNIVGTSDDEKYLSLLCKNVKEGKRRLRGAERLYFIAKNHFEEDYILKHKKTTLIENINTLANDRGIQVISDVQKESAKEQNKNDKETFNQNNVTNQEIENIAGLIRPLSKSKKPKN